MTERFEANEYYHNIYDNKEDMELSVKDAANLLNELYYEKEYHKQTVNAKQALIDVCEQKFRELGYMISCSDNGYIVQKV